MNTNKNLTDRAKGSFLGFAIGDALGWPQERLDIRLGKGSRKKQKPSLEYIKWERRSAGRFTGYREIILPGEYSDDTQLMLATARSLLKGESWNRYLVQQELPIWLLYKRGAGRSVTSAANSWTINVAPWNNTQIAGNYFSTGANGIAMRILPHTILPDLSVEEMHEQIMLNGILTHGHPRALMGAMMYAQAARYLFNLSGTFEYGSLVKHLLDHRTEWSTFYKWEKNYEPWITSANNHSKGQYKQIWEATKQELVAGLNLCGEELQKGSLAIAHDFLKEIGAFDKRTNGSGVVAALSSVYVVSRYAINPTSGVLELAFAYDADTDTLAAMAGGLFGALLGVDWIPSDWLMVQDKDYISQLASQICNTPPVSPKNTDSNRWTKAESQKLIEELSSGKVDNVTIGEIGNATVSPSQNCLQLVKKIKPSCWELRFSFGQSIYITSLASIETASTEPKQKSLHKEKRSVEVLWMGLFEAKPSNIEASSFIYLLSGLTAILEDDMENLGSEDFAQRLNDEDYPVLIAQEMIERGYLISQKDLGKIVPNIGMLILSTSK